VKTKHYESVVIINASLEDNQINDSINRIKDYLKNNGAAVDEIEEWGRKRLAYPIQKSKSGFYLILRYTSGVDFVAKLERFLKIDETIMRYLTVTLDSKALEYYEKRKEEKSESTPEENNVAETSDSKD
jgi:small subunit ribosomal protein S6